MKLFYRKTMTEHIKKDFLLVFCVLVVPFSVFGQGNQTNTGEAPLLRGEQLLLVVLMLQPVTYSRWQMDLTVMTAWWGPAKPSS